MKIDVLARDWGSRAGGSNGMAIAAAFFAHTLVGLGHEVRRLDRYADGVADLVVTTVSPRWQHTMAEAARHGASARLVYWHHAGGVPRGHGHTLAAPPAVALQSDWSHQVVLPPSSWAAEEGGDRTGDEILVAGAGPAKGGHIALAVAKLCPDLKWYVLQGRSAPSDRKPWQALPNATVADGVVDPFRFLARARAVLAPTRFDVHPLLLVEAAVRSIPIVCTDMPATRCAARDSAFYVPMNAAAESWVIALRAALTYPLPRLRLEPYPSIVAGVLGQLAPQEQRAVA